MTPSEDARTLLKLVDRHICALELNLNPNYPDEEWGYTAQLAGIDLPNCLQVLQPYAVEARYEEGPFPLSDSREEILGQINYLRKVLEQEL